MQDIFELFTHLTKGKKEMATQNRTSETLPIIDDYSLIEVVDGFNHRETFVEADLNQLAQSIKENGLLDPLKVAKNPKDHDVPYRLIDGERRLRAIKVLHEQGVEISFPVRVLRGMDDETAVVVAAASNMERADITPLEEANIVAKLEAYGYDVNEIAAKLNRSDQWVRDRKALEGGSRKIKNSLNNGRLPADVAVKLIRKNKEHKDQDKALSEVVTAAGGKKSNTRKAAASKGLGGKVKPNSKEIAGMSLELDALDIPQWVKDVANATLAYVDGTLPAKKYKGHLEAKAGESVAKAA